MRAAGCGALAVVAMGCASFKADGGSLDASGPDASGADASAMNDGAAMDGSRASTGCTGLNATFCDDFEDRSGDNDVAGTLWTSESGEGSAVIDPTDATSPTHSLSFSYAKGVGSLGRGISKKIAVTGGSLRVACWLKVTSSITYVQALSFVIDGRFFAVVIDRDTFVAQYPSGTATTYKPTAFRTKPNTWVKVALAVTFGSAGSVKLTVDDETGHEANADTTPGPTAGVFELLLRPNFGGVAISAPLGIAYDDVVVTP